MKSGWATQLSSIKNERIYNMPHEEQNDALKQNNKIAIERYKFAIKCLGNEKKVVADVACGMGYGSHLLRQAGHDVIGIDKSDEAIDYARVNYPGNYFVWDIEMKCSFNVDVIVCLETLCHIQDPQKFIDELEVKELIVSAPINPNPNDGYKYRLHNLSEAQFRDILKEWEILSEFRQKKYLTLYCKK